MSHTTFTFALSCNNGSRRTVCTCDETQVLDVAFNIANNAAAINAILVETSTGKTTYLPSEGYKSITKFELDTIVEQYI